MLSDQLDSYFWKFNKFTAELRPVPVHDEVWHTIGVDLIGLFLKLPEETSTL